MEFCGDEHGFYPWPTDTLGAASLRVAGVKIEEDTAKVVNLYESEEYAKMLEIVK